MHEAVYGAPRFIPPGHLCFLMHYPTISTHMYDLRCNAGGARSVKVRFG